MLKLEEKKIAIIVFCKDQIVVKNLPSISVPPTPTPSRPPPNSQIIGGNLMLELEEKKRSAIPTPFLLFAHCWLDTEVSGRFNHTLLV